MPKANDQKAATDSGLNFEAQLWAAADKMRDHMDASEYKHVCLGLIFLRYISDAVEEKREELLFGFSDPKSEWFIKDEPQCVVQVLVAMLEPYEGRVFETLQSANMNCRNLRVSGDFSLSASNGERVGVRCRNSRMNRRGIQSLRGQRWPCASTTTWKLARMNLAIRGIDANLGPPNADTFSRDFSRN